MMDTLVRTVIAAVLLLVPGGCTATVVSDARVTCQTVAIADLGPLHATVAIRNADGKYEVWGFGDVGYMVRGEGSSSVARLLVIPNNPAALERRVVPGSLDALARVPGIRSITPLPEPPGDAVAVLNQLNQRFNAGRSLAKWGTHGSLDYIEYRTDERPYNLYSYNCHDFVAQILEHLGYRVTGKSGITRRVLRSWE